MNIKDIARIAGTSISTVSKVVNGKDTSISEKTREKILTIVKEYNYSPYANLKKSDRLSLLLGLLVKKEVHPEFLRGLVEVTKKHGFGLVIHQDGASESSRVKFLSSLSNRNLDGLIWEETPQVARKLADTYVKEKIPIRCFGVNEYDAVSDHFHIDYKKLGYMATETLIQKHHKKIGCLVHHVEEQKSKDFIEGYRNCLFDLGIKYNSVYMQSVDSHFSINSMLLLGITSIICLDEWIAGNLYQQAIQKNLIIPRDLSLISLVERVPPEYFTSHIATIDIGLSHLGYTLGKSLIEEVERKETSFNLPSFTYTVSDENAITIPSCMNNPKVLVMGSINMDTLIHVSELPCTGITAIASACKNTMGGKGANQAIALARLGMQVSLLARIGRDADGLLLHDALHKKHVNSEHLIFDEKVGTGRAYIYILPNGESSITVYLGANSTLSKADIDRHMKAFDEIAYCLLQTEISVELVLYAAKLCRQRGVKTILKPANLHQDSLELLQYVDYFIPNEKEAKRICGNHLTYKQQAEFFIKKGVGSVIITLAENGCYFYDGEDSRYFSAMTFPVIDTTGAADAFVATFTTSLAMGIDIDKAIKMASYAGSFSITQEGAQTAMLDKEAYENLLTTVDSLITVSNEKKRRTGL